MGSQQCHTYVLTHRSFFVGHPQPGSALQPNHPDRVSVSYSIQRVLLQSTLKCVALRFKEIEIYRVLRHSDLKLRIYKS